MGNGTALPVSTRAHPRLYQTLSPAIQHRAKANVPPGKPIRPKLGLFDAAYGLV